MLHCGRRRILLLEGGLTAPEARGGDEPPIRGCGPAPTGMHRFYTLSISTWPAMEFDLRSESLSRSGRSSKVVAKLGRRKSPPFQRTSSIQSLTTRFRYRRSAFVLTHGVAQD